MSQKEGTETDSKNVKDVRIPFHLPPLKKYWSGLEYFASPVFYDG